MRESKANSVLPEPSTSAPTQVRHDLHLVFFRARSHVTSLLVVSPLPSVHVRPVLLWALANLGWAAPGMQHSVWTILLPRLSYVPRHVVRESDDPTSLSSCGM